MRPVDNRPIANPVRRLSKKRQQELADKLKADQEAESLSASSVVSLADADSSEQIPSEISACAIRTEEVDKNTSHANYTDSPISASTFIEGGNTNINTQNPKISENAEQNAEHPSECSAIVPIVEVPDVPEVSAPMLLFDEEVTSTF